MRKSVRQMVRHSDLPTTIASLTRIATGLTSWQSRERQSDRWSEAR